MVSSLEKELPSGRLMTPAELDAALARNARWMESKIKQGYQVYDLGYDTERLTRSPFYKLERDILESHNYPTIPLEK